MSKKELPSFDELQMWSVINVADWLKEAGFEDCVNPFMDANVDGVKLSQLSEQDLLYMGKVPLAQRRKILKAVNAVAKTENKPTKGIGKLGNKLGIGKPAPPPKDFKPESNNNNDDTYDWDSDEWEDGMDDTEGGFEAANKKYLELERDSQVGLGQNLDAVASVEESFYLDAQERPTIFARLASNQGNTGAKNICLDTVLILRPKFSTSVQYIFAEVHLKLFTQYWFI
ncbi:uncharacterized protein LOC106167364 isoform X2 [Lingula anatina]|uniref:Uncharacterized protein LOC106167364 isoform X2 n=1 Tax=Lingula anatina TaxID=7574 RepID=A0A1S3ITQ0_LINAN|nr:uncharacterized protein LOC106167364 isoform X2 [Lingula anatina]|eukprot:XP_013401580.1 uncharacterized protein LOC106167364 isoform X2 [Lingula anatina]